MVLVLTDNAGITPLNRISCAYPPLPGKTGGLGEIYVNVERASELGRGTVNQSRELALYIAHGVDHLSGASDRTPALRARMLRRERAWLKEADGMGLPGGLVGR